MPENQEHTDISRGLKDVYLDTSEASYIDGTLGRLLYRGYDIHDLAEKSTFEEITYLLLYGKLPNRDELAKLDAFLRANRGLPKELMQVIDLLKTAHPMDVLRTVISAHSAFDPDVDDNSREAVIRKGLRLTAIAPTIMAAHHRLSSGQKPIDPNPNLTHAGNFLYMLFGEEPTPEDAKIMDVDFILHADHGANASAFAARVTISTLSDLHSAVVSGIGTLKGPLHGGAAEAVMKMAEQIGTPENASSYATNLLSTGQRIMGFGHRVYKAEDPRARHLKLRSKTLGIHKGKPEWFEILQRLQEAMEPYKKRGIHVNVDFFAGSIYYLLGIPDNLFVPIFALGRIPGWTLQALEQLENNILIRPRLKYIGPMDLEYIPIDQRD